jgi:hypothetical protein
MNDAETTPVLHTFTPASRVAENTARWVDREHNNGIAIGYASVSYSVKEPTSVGGVFRQKVNYAEPILDVTNPLVPVLLGTARVNCEYIFPDIMSDQQRKNVVKKFNGLTVIGLANTIGDNIVVQSLPY